MQLKLSLILDHLFPLILEPHGATSLPDPISEFPLPDVSPAATIPSLDLTWPNPTPLLLLTLVFAPSTKSCLMFLPTRANLWTTSIALQPRRCSNSSADAATAKWKKQRTARTVTSPTCSFGIPDHLSVNEYRNPDLSGFIKAIGSTTLVLVFHPIHLDQFDVTCNGLGSWQGAPAYLLNFQQRPDRPNNMSRFVTPKGTYTVSLKGTAWVDASTFQVVHLETDLLNPIPDLFLDLEHQSLDYGPVEFVARNVTAVASSVC